MLWKARSMFRGAPIYFTNLVLISTLVLIGCQSSTTPQISPTEQLDASLIWSLDSQQQIKNHQRPLWVNVDCNAEPCFLETWSSGKEQHTAFWSDSKYHWTETIYFKTRWQAINGVLLSCLGHPYSVPIALDPTGNRKLLGQNKWVLTLSGNNRCHLQGQIVIATTKESLNLQELYVDNQKWAAGGREKAKQLLGQSIEKTAFEKKPSSQKDQTIDDGHH